MHCPCRNGLAVPIRRKSVTSSTLQFQHKSHPPHNSNIFLVEPMHRRFSSMAVLSAVAIRHMSTAGVLDEVEKFPSV
ncbi:hypothetical protein TNIN_181871 [Trichonephila inaurata madagascariensis]|uniref:Uncharacterized protein n=1 Tax=Trichonephila inaurata madagascariensis TaxID=2747483 RepID=A0A8X6XQ07_9ARAC|nr:hypothetical protein TNIN_181871 [Trichonephila inaurata madagascariensis]